MVLAQIFWSHVQRHRSWISTREMSFFSPPKLLPTFAETIIHQRGVVAEFFEKNQYGLWIYDFKMWAAFSGGWNTIHLLWALNQTDHCFHMIHDASMQKCNAFYHSAFLSVHILYMTSATVNSNMMRFLHNTQYVSCKFLCQFPPLIMVIYFFYMTCISYFDIIYSAHVLYVFFLCFNMSISICSIFSPFHHIFCHIFLLVLSSD